MQETHLIAEISSFFSPSSPLCVPHPASPEPLQAECPRAPPLAPRQPSLQDFALIGD